MRIADERKIREADCKLKIQILTLTPYSWSRTYASEIFEVRKKSVPFNKIWKIQLIELFYQEDEYFIYARKKEFVTKELKNYKARKRCIGCLRRETKDKSAWKPCVSQRVCSAHSIDGIPTVANPDPTINVGYFPQNIS